MKNLNINIDNAKFSDHFSVAEMFRTNANADNSQCGLDELLNLRFLCTSILEPARRDFCKPIMVNSGYRSKAVNTAIGGVKNSQHMKGEAADITLGSKAANKDLFNYIKEYHTFDQLIDEKDYSWIHVSVKREGSNRNQVKHL